jgi:hypothetical protein
MGIGSCSLLDTANGVYFRLKPRFWIEDVTLTTASSLTWRIVSMGREHSWHYAPPTFKIHDAFPQTDELHPKLGPKCWRFPQAPHLYFWTVSA